LGDPTPFTWLTLVGLAVTAILGCTTKYFVRRIGNSLPMEAPSIEIELYWDKLRKMQTGGDAIGHVERLLFFAALWIPNGWPILTSWLVFKLAYYWQSANFTAFPVEPPDAKQAAWLVAKRQLGANHVATALVGTGLNLLFACVGMVIAKWI
jgi:hypothetical protein